MSDLTYAQTRELVRASHAVASASACLAINYDGKVQLTWEALRDMPVLSFTSRHDDKYPWQANTTIANVEFFGILTQDEYDRYISETSPASA